MRSFRLGLVGKSDVVEFHPFREEKPVMEGSLENAVELEGLEGRWIPFPVEYKLGKPKSYRCDEVQLCAQALCLEEMLNVEITEASLFYGKIKRRHPVRIDKSLRDLTESAAMKLHDLIDKAETPRAKYEPKCRNCSMKDLCLPEAMASEHSVSRYLSRELAGITGRNNVEAPP